MAVRVKLLVASVLLAALLEASVFAQVAGHRWLLFLFYGAAVLLTSGMKVSLFPIDSTMSVSFPFILLAVVQLSPFQALAVAAISVLAQCRLRAHSFFSLVQISFNVANVINATVICRLIYLALGRLGLSLPPALAAGAVAYFFANTIPLAFIIAWSDNRKPFALWRSDFAWFLPFYLVGAALSALAYFIHQQYGLLTELLLVPVVYTMYRAYNAQIARMRDSAQHIAEMDALHIRTIESLAMAIEAKDQETHDHLLRVRVYVTEVGKAFHLDAAEMQAITTAALLHDIGKLAVPERIINKPGKLTPEEFEKMKIHPSVGADILERVRFPYPVVPIVRAHHEWWNGMGYPDGLKGEEIPIGARILSVVDSFDAMASDRPYRTGMPLDQAMAKVKEMAGTQFDPQVVAVLEQRYVELEQQARREGENLRRLETDVQVARGLAPGAGFEQAAGMSAPGSKDAHGASLVETQGSRARADCLPAISALAGKLQTIVLRSADAAGAFSAEEMLALLDLWLRQAVSFECMAFYQARGDELIAHRGGRCYERYFSSLPLVLGAGISGWAAKHEQSIVNGNATVEPHYLRRPREELELRSALALPLRDTEGRVLGVLSLYALGEDSFSRDDLSILEGLEPLLSLAFSSSAARELMREASLACATDRTCSQQLDPQVSTAGVA